MCPYFSSTHFLIELVLCLFPSFDEVEWSDSFFHMKLHDILELADHIVSLNIHF
jgi:hypothetical protein